MEQSKPDNDEDDDDDGVPNYEDPPHPWHPAQATISLHQGVYLISAPYNKLGAIVVEQIEGEPNKEALQAIQCLANMEHLDLRDAHIPHAALAVAEVVAQYLHGNVLWFSGQNRPPLSASDRESDDVM